MLSNSTNNTHHSQQDWNATDIIPISITGLVILIGCGMVLNTVLQNLHEIIKGILNILIVHNILSAIALQILKSGWDKDYTTSV